MATPPLPDQRLLQVLGLEDFLHLLHRVVWGEDVAGAEVGRLQDSHEFEELRRAKLLSFEGPQLDDGSLSWLAAR